jgi:Tfp pilus assembly protein PilX
MGAWEEVERYLWRKDLRREWILNETGEARLKNAESWIRVSQSTIVTVACRWKWNCLVIGMLQTRMTLTCSKLYCSLIWRLARVGTKIQWCLRKN